MCSSDLRMKGKGRRRKAPKEMQIKFKKDAAGRDELGDWD